MNRMKSRMIHLVLLAACNGEAFIGEQIDSVLRQLSAGDFLLISLDPSADDTRMVIERKKELDERILLYEGPGLGLQKNFEFLLNRALELMRLKEIAPEKALIFLCDQDDIWMPDKIERCESAIQSSGAGVAVHDALIIDGSKKTIDESFMKRHGSRAGFVNNLIRNSYIGCCMAFRGSELSEILPFPKPLPMHDQWIGLQIDRHSKTVWIGQPLIAYRRHDQNASSMQHASLKQMLIWRIQMIRALLQRRKGKR